MGRSSPAVAAACLLLVNPYLPLASATILTEIPSLLMLVAGTLLWVRGQTESMAERGAPVGWPGVAKLLGGGFLLGLAITSRQYYLAILPAMAVTFLVSCQRLGETPPRLGVIAAVGSGVIAAAPILGLFAIWGGLTPPSMHQNISYSNYTAAIGINLLRPINAVLYIGIYMLPVLVLQPSAGLRVPRILVLLALVMAGLLAISVPEGNLWCGPESDASCGPIKWLYDILSARSANLARAYNGIGASAGCAGLFLLIRAIWSDRAAIIETPGVVLALAFLAFFLVEQLFVGGNIPFYERYILQIAPMLGLALGSYRSFRVNRALIGSTPLILYGLFRLWRTF